MYRPRWAHEGGGGGDGGGGGRSYANAARNGGESVEERQQRAAVMKRLFQVKLELEGNRKNLGRGQIFTVTKDRVGNGEPDPMDPHELCKLLEKSGLTKDQVLGIKQNEFRKGQTEVLVTDDVKLDLKEMQRVIEKETMRMSVGLFDKVEEVFMIYGLPLTTDVEGMKDCIKEAVEPFVKNIISIEPSKYYDSKSTDFFKGKLNGAWRVVVNPKMNVAVPNFIVVDKEIKAPGNVVYKKKQYERPEMCSDCYREGHFRRAKECEGIRNWNDYANEFFQKWSTERQKMGADLRGSNPTKSTRVDTLNLELTKEKKRNEELTEKVSKVEEEKEIQEVSQRYILELEAKEKEYAEKLERLVKEKEEVIDKMNEAVADLAKAKVDNPLAGIIIENDNMVDKSNKFISSLDEMQEELNYTSESLEIEFEEVMTVLSPDKKDDIVDDLVDVPLNNKVSFIGRSETDANFLEDVNNDDKQDDNVGGFSNEKKG